MSRAPTMVGVPLRFRDAPRITTGGLQDLVVLARANNLDTTREFTLMRQGYFVVAASSLVDRLKKARAFPISPLESTP